MLKVPEELNELRKQLLNREDTERATVVKFIAYVDSINKTNNKGKDLTFGMPVSDFARLFIKYNSVGITIDGVNAVITGYNRVFITYVGYKNKVLQVYPEAKFDVQLVREEDTFSVAKESGSVVYSHQIANPFVGNTGIIGAYCVIETKRGEALETLGKTDFDNMKAQSDMKSGWDKWESEFWLKSVIKRACKRHFNDIIADIDKVDNEDYNLENEKADDSKKKAILEAHNGNNS